jgi:hypothetical protein
MSIKKSPRVAEGEERLEISRRGIFVRQFVVDSMFFALKIQGFSPGLIKWNVVICSSGMAAISRSVFYLFALSAWRLA